MDEVRITLAVATLLRVFLEDIDEPRYGYDLMEATGFASGKIYPILTRLHAAGWLVKETERVDPFEAGRPARRFYRLNPAAVATARAAVAEVVEQVAPRRATGLIRRPAGGLA